MKVHIDMNYSTPPTEATWDDYIEQQPGNIDLPYAKRRFFNKTHNEVFAGFKSNVIERTDELHFMPMELFSYYIQYYFEYIQTGVYQTHKMEDRWFFRGEVSSCFLGLIKEKLDEYPVASQSMKQDLLDTVDYMLQNIDHFNSEDNIEVYGDAVQKLKHIKALTENL